MPSVAFVTPRIMQTCEQCQCNMGRFENPISDIVMGGPTGFVHQIELVSKTKVARMRHAASGLVGKFT